MKEQTMKLRCKEGDLAVIVHDTPPCADNIGRIVQVRGPAHMNKAYDLTCWWIRTVSPTPLWVEQGEKLTHEVVDWNSGVDHPDSWLVPLPAVSESDSEADRVDAPDSAPPPARKPHSRRQDTVPVAADSMAYRPRSYFGFEDKEIELMTHVKGVLRRRSIRNLLDAGRVDEISEWLSQNELTAEDRTMIGRVHPRFMGGEYLPGLRHGEIEIARISIESTTGDVQAVYARWTGKRYAYRVVDEYQGDTLSRPTFRTSLRPLTMGELIRFFLGAWDLLNCLDFNFDGELKGMLRFFEGESAFYPCFDAALRALVRERFAPAQPAAGADADDAGSEHADGPHQGQSGS